MGEKTNSEYSFTLNKPSVMKNIIYFYSFLLVWISLVYYKDTEKLFI